MYRQTGCDYCNQPQSAGPIYRIKLTRTPNADVIYAELCDVCLKDIQHV